ncbi:MAG: TonB-dependent receptor [Gammaproteobacteria bacterium]|nr:TonB-dependent receptor [Gammaproteobacteria bacterium]
MRGAGPSRTPADGSPDVGSSDSFDGLSASLGAIVPLGDIFQARLLADYSTRAPAGEELYTDGAHPATSSFEIGDPNLDEEKAINLSAILDAQGDRWSLHSCLYLTEFSDFVYQHATGEEMQGLTVLLYRQADATFVGLDLEGTATVASWEGGQLELSAFYDTVSAELDISGNDNLPRIPPERAGLGLDLSWGGFDASIDYVHAFKQNDTADFELATDAYDDLRAYLGWAGEWGNTSFTVFLQGRNLTDDEQRLHTSIVKDLVPQPGRTIEGGVRISF